MNEIEQKTEEFLNLLNYFINIDNGTLEKQKNIFLIEKKYTEAFLMRDFLRKYESFIEIHY